MYKWKPNKAMKSEYGKKMQEIEKFCKEHDIQVSTSHDSYYFTINNVNYRVSNHTIEASNSGAYDDMGNQKRELYHEVVRNSNTIYIHAGKTRIIEIYNNLAAGYELDGKGNRKMAMV